MRLLSALFVLLIISGCAFVFRDDHFSPSSDHGTLLVHRRIPPNARMDLGGENFHLHVWASDVTSEVAWFGPLIPIFPGLLLGGMLDEKDGPDERLTITIEAWDFNSLTIDLGEVSVYMDSGIKPLKPSFVERNCYTKLEGYDGPNYDSPRNARVSGRQTLSAEERWARTASGEYCLDVFYLRYDIEPRNVESFEVRFGQIAAGGVVSTPEPIRFKRSVEHWFLGVP